MIRAYCNAPTHGAVRFDASPWFEIADLNAIRRLVDKKWSAAPAEKAAKGVIEFDGYFTLYSLRYLLYARIHETTDCRPEYYVDTTDALA